MGWYMTGTLGMSGATNLAIIVYVYGFKTNHIEEST